MVTGFPDWSAVGIGLNGTVCIAGKCVSIDVTQLAAFLDAHLVSHGETFLSIAELGIIGMEGDHFIAIGRYIDSGFPTEIIIHKRCGIDCQFEPFVPDFSGIDIAVCKKRTGRVGHSQQLVLRVCLIPGEIDTQATAEEAPFCSELDGIAYFRF